VVTCPIDVGQADVPVRRGYNSLSRCFLAGSDWLAHPAIE